jgi:hypothetical protein
VEAAYTREEFELIRAAAARTFGTALRRIRSGREHLRRWHDGEFPPPAGRRELFRQQNPATADYLTGEALDSLLRTGDVPLATGGYRTVLARHARALGGAGAGQTWARLFLTLPEASALAVLLVCDQGWNRASVALHGRACGRWGPPVRGTGPASSPARSATIV